MRASLKLFYQFFLRKMLGTRYGSVGTRFPRACSWTTLLQNISQRTWVKEIFSKQWRPLRIKKSPPKLSFFYRLTCKHFPKLSEAPRFPSWPGWFPALRVLRRPRPGPPDRTKNPTLKSNTGLNAQKTLLQRLICQVETGISTARELCENENSSALIQRTAMNMMKLILL